MNFHDKGICSELPDAQQVKIPEAGCIQTDI
jgi:hypothetical protein